MANDAIDKLAKTLVETLPQGLRSVRDDLEKNFRAVLQSSLGKLDLVTREEFEVQEAVLARSREKLDALEARLARMESGPAKQGTQTKKVAKKKTTKKKSKKTAKKKTGH
jgi:BMFP domain-containing protein YqiC